jgi:hypothetical protein
MRTEYYVTARYWTQWVKQQELLAVRWERAQLELQTDDPLTPARLRGLDFRESILRDEHADWLLVSDSEAGVIMGCSGVDVETYRRAGYLLALQFGTRDYLYPLWQFNRSRQHPLNMLTRIPGLREVLNGLGDTDPLTKAQFFLAKIWPGQQNAVDFLSDGGDIAKVVSMAEHFCHEGFTGL